MWQTNYASTVPKNLGVEGNFRLCSEGDFLTGRLCSLCFVILMYFLQICIPNLMTPQPKRKLKRLSLFIDWLLWWHNGDHFSYLVLLCFRNHPYITSAKGLGRWVRNMALFADFQYIQYLCSHSLGGRVRKGQKYADVIYRWSLSIHYDVKRPPNFLPTVDFNQSNWNGCVCLGL